MDAPRLVAFEVVFAPVAEPPQFATLRVSADAGTVIWPNGADLDPDVLYGEFTEDPMQRYFSTPNKTSNTIETIAFDGPLHAQFQHRRSP